LVDLFNRLFIEALKIVQAFGVDVSFIDFELLSGLLSELSHEVPFGNFTVNQNV
jgi:hypothetical protein